MDLNSMLLAIGYLLVIETKSAFNQEPELVKRLLANYSKSTRPLRNALDTVNVTVGGIRLTSVEYYDEMTATLSLLGWLDFQWFDEYLVWKNDPIFSHIDHIFLPESSIWTPQLSVITYFTNMSSFILGDGKRLGVFKDGRVSWYPTGRLQTKCLPNLRLFPFDTQVCDLRFESWGVPTSQINLIPAKERKGGVYAVTKIDSHWTENSQWTIVGNSTIAGRQSGSNTARVCFSFVIYRIEIRRKPMYQVVNIILPSIIISAAETVVLYLPVNDPTRAQISVTCLLAYTVFQSMIMQSVPRAIDSVPWMSLFIDLQMFYIGFIAILGDTLVYAICGSEFYSEPPSNRLLGLAEKIGKSLYLNNRSLVGKRLNSISFVKQHKNLDHAMMTTMQEAFDKWQKFTVKKLLDKQWLYIAQVLQRLILIVYASLVIATPVVLVAAAFAIGSELEFQQYKSNC